MWQPVYLLLLDAAEYPTVPRLMFQMRALKDAAPSDGILLLMINFMDVVTTPDMAVPTKNLWVQFFTG